MSKVLFQGSSIKYYAQQARYYWNDRYYRNSNELTVQHLNEDKILQLIGGMTLHYAGRMANFYTVCKKYIPVKDLLKSPLVYNDIHDYKKVIIFPNFKIQPDIGPYAEDVAQWAYKSKTISLLVNQYKKDLAGKAKVRWETVYRGFKYLRKKEVMGTSRWMTRYLALSEAGWSDDRIRDVAQQIEADLAPPEIIICDKPEDYFRMFQVKATYSCMYNDPKGKFNHHGEAGRAFWEELKKIGMFPSLWYHYNPHMTGVFSIVGGEPRARAFIIQPDLSKDYKYLSPSYAENGAHQFALATEMARRGFKQEVMRGTLRIQQNFRVPGVDSSKGIVCPLPHCDDVKKPMYVRYHKDTKEFEWSGEQQKGFMSVPDTYAHAGYVHAAKICK